MPGGGEWADQQRRAGGNRDVFSGKLRDMPVPTQQEPASSGYDENGRFHLNTNVTDDQAKEMAARVTREQFERYMNEFAPVERSLIGTLGGNSAQQAAATSVADAERARSSLDRMRSRYGTSLTAGQRSAEDRQFAKGMTLSSLGAINTARQMDEDRDFNLRGTLLNIGNNLSSSAMGGLTDSSNNANARQNAHNQAMANHRAQRSQQQAQTASTVMTLGALALGI